MISNRSKERLHFARMSDSGLLLISFPTFACQISEVTNERLVSIAKSNHAQSISSTTRVKLTGETNTQTFFTLKDANGQTITGTVLVSDSCGVYSYEGKATEMLVLD